MIHQHEESSSSSKYYVQQNLLRVIDTITQGEDIEDSLRGCREGSLRSLAGYAETANSSVVPRHFTLELALKLVHVVRNKPVVEVFSTQMAVA